MTDILRHRYLLWTSETFCNWSERAFANGHLTAWSKLVIATQILLREKAVLMPLHGLVQTFKSSMLAAVLPEEAVDSVPFPYPDSNIRKLVYMLNAA